MGLGPKGDKNVNNLAFGNAGAFNQQQGGLQNNIMGGLEGAQGRSNQVFDAAFGGYQNLLGGMGQPGSGGGGGGGMNASIAALQGLGGPGNPWAGQLGADIRTRGDSILPGFYDRIKSEQTRLQNIQGGYNPGYTAQMSKLARDQSQSAQKGQLDREISLGEKSAQAQAAQAAFNMQREGMIAGMRRSGAASAAASGQQDFRNQMAILDAMGGLRGQTPGEVAMYLGGGLNNIGNFGIGNQQVGQLMQYNQPKLPAWQQALGIAGNVAGGLAPFLGGFGGGGGGGGQSGGQGGWW